MKLALLGAGGFRTPAIYEPIAASRTRTRYDAVALHDVDGDRLARIEAVLGDIDRATSTTVRRTSTTSLEEALEGADVVYCAVRVGGLDGRLVDETVAIGAGAIGQETAGAGGIGFALRTVPVVMNIARVVDRVAPNAVFINFTNPVGLVTEALRRILGDRVIGICDAPEDLCRRVARALERDAGDVWFDYFGINHLGWLKGVYERGRDLLPGLLADSRRLESIQEGALFGPEWLQALGMIPNEYLYYYDFQTRVLDAMRSGSVRAAYLARQQAGFYGGTAPSPGSALAEWQRAIHERESHYMDEAWDGRAADRENLLAAEPGGYGKLALELVDALNGDGRSIRILNVANRSSLPFLDSNAVVEVPCVVTKGGVAPVAVGPVPLDAQALILRVRAAERLAIDAALSGSRELALRALATHPLVPSVDVAREILAGYLAKQPALRSVLVR